MLIVATLCFLLLVGAWIIVSTPPRAETVGKVAGPITSGAGI